MYCRNAEALPTSAPSFMKGFSMKYGFWMPVFGGWLRNVPDEGMEAPGIRFLNHSELGFETDREPVRPSMRLPFPENFRIPVASVSADYSAVVLSSGSLFIFQPV